ncbi:MAG: mannose-1-phosphate guanylyltransferase/mannose-6-phosphate isomerase [Legionella sp.]|uniref:mannose-1-phosphate guanylyltransferase/mannose-6-phosphate isomerase n=1 Tax=Legionella sp. TaxID=459 RepID=UPI00284B385B|nr:mannose-1-phosphate guanylyltransferase/mannose-6-phosphate isomerase [Legionella sp.]
MELIPVILSGGEGSRLWPVSRLHHPKPFIKLKDGHSLLQKNFLKAQELRDINEIVTVTNKELLFKTLDNYSELNVQNIALSFILEPYARNTASAVISAALYIAKKYGEQAVMLVLPADHLVSNHQAFKNAVNDALSLALDNKLVTFGIKPNKPATEYGYIEVDGFHVVRFVEKPNQENAERYVSAGNFFWNSGMFCFKAGTILDEAQKHCPEIYKAIRHCLESASQTNSEDYFKITLQDESFKHVPENSVDYAILEKSQNLAAVLCDINWCDLGSWDAMANLVPLDQHGNQIEADVLLRGVSNCYIRGYDRLIAAIGLDDLMIIDTPDALLVAAKERAQEVKLLYQELKRENNETCTDHRITYRPWGSYTVLDKGEGFKIKHIEVNPKSCLSLQMHQQRSEHWVVVSGKGIAHLGDNEVHINANQSCYVPIGYKHQLSNPYDEPLVLIEVQCGSYLGEDDIVRFEDKYGRC